MEIKKVESKVVFNNTQLLLILILKMFIGWHFLYEGIIKLANPAWSAASYLMYSDWIFSGIFHAMADNSTILAIVNFCNIWGLILIGLALIFGVFTRIAAIGGAALLLLYYTANPPFTIADSMKEGSYMIIDKNLIEMLALILIAFLPSLVQVNLKLVKDFINKKIHKNKEKESQPEHPCREVTKEERETLERRNFIYSLASIPFISAFTWAAVRTNAFSKPMAIDSISGATTRTFEFTDLKDLKGTLPRAKIGNVEMSRMFMGCNLIGGWAHSRDLIYVPSLVKKYHTQEKVFETLQLGEQCGMNAIILNTSLTPLINAYWKETRGKIQFISDCAGVGDVDKGIKISIDNGAATCYIQGEITERILRRGESFEIVGEWIEKIRRQGVPAGIGAHSLEVVKRCVDIGIKPDYWVKTLHHINYWSAKPEERHDNIWCTNPEETIEYMKNLEQPWIAFKVLAAGAIHPNEGFKYAFEGGADFICVGMYDFQIVDDVNIAAEVLSQQINRQRPWRC
ncbi:MAG: DoxX family protein [Tannerellaceae bacterium]|nr:DoxX family protein [Tannerellaceae bacterium]